MRFRLMIIICTLHSFIYSQDLFAQSTPTATNTTVSLNTFLAGVKGRKTNITTYTNSRTASLMSDAVEEYLELMGFGLLPRGGHEADRSLCLYATVDFEYDQVDDYTITSMTLKFESCNGDYWIFKSNETINFLNYTATAENWKVAVKTNLRKMYGYMKPAYNPAYTFKLAGGYKTNYTEEYLRGYYTTNHIDPIEGIYEVSFPDEKTPKYRLGVVKSGDVFNAIYLSGARNDLDWNVGDVKAVLTPTASADLYKATWYMNDKTTRDALIEFDAITMKVVMKSKEPPVDLYIKLFPDAQSGSHSSSAQSGISSGTGFALSSDGYIVTNYHVVSDAKSITVKGINGNFNKAYSAVVVSTDQNNDLAILKIDDNTFTSLGSIPYTVSFKTNEVGSSVYVLGYPLRATMGDEVKLTNGIISSKSGYKGDLSTYQISAPVQPGNSGGPMFDTRGNISGIINARHAAAENATYAIKTTYLSNLLESTSVPVKLPAVSTLSNKPITEIVSQIKRFTYIIEVQ